MNISNNKVMSNKKWLIKTLVIAGVLSVVTACSSPAPTHLIVSPELNMSPAQTNLYNNTAQLDVVDMRVAKHIVSIVEEGEPAVVLSSQKGLDDVVKKSLTTGWKSQGLDIDSTSKNKILVTIEKSAIVVNQYSMSHLASSEITMTVKIDNGSKVLTSTFKNKGSFDDALSADIELLERDFNHNLGAVLKQIMLSKDIQLFLAP